MERRNLLFLAGLAPLACYSKPQLTVRSAQIAGADLFGISIRVQLAVYNNNGFDVLVRRVRATTTLERNFQLPTLDFAPQLWLAAGQESSLTAQLTIPWHLVLPLLNATFSADALSYQLQGEADVTATRALGLRVDRFPLDEKGSIPRATVLSAAQVRFPMAR